MLKRIERDKLTQWTTQVVAGVNQYTELVDRGEVIGAVLRTKPEVKPVYVSIGHMVDLQTAIHWVLACCRGYRLPEPARLAHLAATGKLREEKSIIVSH